MRTICRIMLTTRRSVHGIIRVLCLATTVHRLRHIRIFRTKNSRCRAAAERIEDGENHQDMDALCDHGMKFIQSYEQINICLIPPVVGSNYGWNLIATGGSDSLRIPQLTLFCPLGIANH